MGSRAGSGGRRRSRERQRTGNLAARTVKGQRPLRQDRAIRRDGKGRYVGELARGLLLRGGQYAGERGGRRDAKLSRRSHRLRQVSQSSLCRMEASSVLGHGGVLYRSVGA